MLRCVLQLRARPPWGPHAVGWHKPWAPTEWCNFNRILSHVWPIIALHYSKGASSIYMLRSRISCAGSIIDIDHGSSFSRDSHKHTRLRWVGLTHRVFDVRNRNIFVVCINLTHIVRILCVHFMFLRTIRTISRQWCAVWEVSFKTTLFVLFYELWHETPRSWYYINIWFRYNGRDPGQQCLYVCL